MSLLQTWTGATNDKSPTLRGKKRFHRSTIPSDKNSRLAPGVTPGSTIMISALLIQELFRRGSGVLSWSCTGPGWHRAAFPQAVIAGRVCKCCLIRELDRALYLWFYICVSGNKTQRTKENRNEARRTQVNLWQSKVLYTTNDPRNERFQRGTHTNGRNVRKNAL